MENHYTKDHLRKPPKAPPLWVWGITGLLFGVELIFAWYLPPSTDRFLENPAFFSQRLQNFAHLEHDVQKIVVLGTSRTAHAFFYDHYMERFAKRNGFHKIKFIRFVKTTGMLEDFASLWAPILEVKPDIIFCEATLIQFCTDQDSINQSHQDMFDKSDQDSRNKLHNFLKHLLFEPLPSISWNDPQFDDRKLFVLDRQSTDNALEKRQKWISQVRKIRQLPAFSEHQAFFNHLRKDGIKFILLDVPSFQEYTEFSPEQRKNIQALRKQYKELYEIEYLAFPERMGLEYYQDFGHLNLKGREHYCRWFLSELQKDKK